MRRKFGTTAALVLAGALGTGCDEIFAQEAPAPAGQPAPVPVPAPAPQQAPAPGAPAVDEPHGSRPIDDGAIRALAEEVARLRAELARLRDEKPADDDGAAPSADAPAAGTPAGAAEPAAGTGATSPAATPPVAEPTERVVERVVEREVPVYVDREVVVEREVLVEAPPIVVETVVETTVEVVYEQVVYRDTVCYQSIAHNHVHAIGCGHHYYGCACHPWYYHLDGGFDIQFVFVDRDEHGHWRPRGRRPYAVGYRDGYRDGDRDDDRRDGRHDDRSPGRPIRENPPSARDDRPSAPVHRGDGQREQPGSARPSAPVIADRDRLGPGGASGRSDRPSGDIERESRGPRAPNPRAAEPSRGANVTPAGPFERPASGERDIARQPFGAPDRDRTPDGRTDRGDDRTRERDGGRDAGRTQRPEAGDSRQPSGRTPSPERGPQPSAPRGGDVPAGSRHRAPGQDAGTVRQEPQLATPVPAPPRERARDRDDPPRRTAGERIGERPADRPNDRAGDRPERRVEPPTQRPPVQRPPAQRPPVQRPPQVRAPNRPEAPDRRRQRKHDGEE